MGNPGASENEVLEAAQKSGVMTFILKGETIWTNEESLAYTQHKTSRSLSFKRKNKMRSRTSAELARTVTLII